LLSLILETKGPGDTLDSQFQPVIDLSDPAIFENVAEAQQQYIYAPSSGPTLTNPMKVQDAIRGFKLGKAPGPKGLTNRTLKHHPQRAISLIVEFFNLALLGQHFLPVWNHACVISMLKPGKDPSLPSSYRPIYQQKVGKYLT
jgi:hypothetical protein